MNIMKFRPLFFFISLSLITLSTFSIIKWGFRTSIDFAGGSVWDVTLPSKPEKEKISEVFSKNNIELSSVISIGEDNYSLKFKNVEPEEKLKLNNINNMEKIGPILKIYQTNNNRKERENPPKNPEKGNKDESFEKILKDETRKIDERI